MKIPESILKSVEKPGRYIGGEWGEVVKDPAKVDIRFAFCFPDTYEIGMSNLGIRILYSILNDREDTWCERAYAPWADMEEKMREHSLPVCTLESGTPLAEFDFVGFSLQYELCYTNMLNMLSMSGIPLESKDRKNDDPIVVFGGPCTYNSEPVADFADICLIGEGEEEMPDLMEVYKKHKAMGFSREAFLREVSHIESMYVPSLYDVEYKEDGTIKSFTPKYPDVPAKVKKRIVKDMNKAPFPKNLVMPFIQTVQDRIVLEVYRG